MLRWLRSVWDIFWTLGLTLLGQPAHPGPTRADRQNVQVKQTELKRRARRPATTGQLLGQLVRAALVTAVQVVSHQPAPRPARQSDPFPEDRRP